MPPDQGCCEERFRLSGTSMFALAVGINSPKYRRSSSCEQNRNVTFE
jgi:hypothetical protein